MIQLQVKYMMINQDIRLAYGDLEGFRNMIQETCDTTTNSA